MTDIWEWEPDDFLLIDTDIHVVVAVSGNSEFDDGDDAIEWPANWTIVKLVEVTNAKE